MGNDDTFNHAFLSEKGRTTDLGTLGGMNSQAQGINSSGQIVGSSNLKGYAAGPHAFLYADGKMIDLTKQIPPEADWVLNTATAINDSGQIVGNGTHSDKIRAFLLTPIPTLTVTGGRNLVTTHPRLVIRGQGDRSVRRVTYRVAPSERFKAAAGTTKWHFTARLHPGRNVIAIRATGLEGNSARTHITVTRN
jgi:probable HAF family extracellular repeat protein